MNIGEIIKKLRRERDMTQEQLAEYLNLTTQAVSKWETGASLPDITLLPILANLFGVSSDVLLGIDVTAKDKRIQEIYDAAYELYLHGFHNAEAAEVLRAGLREFPNSHKLMSGLMTRLWMERENDKPEPIRNEMTQEVMRLGEKILAESADDECRQNAIQILCFLYCEPEIGQREKAVALAEKMPSMWLSRDVLLAQINGFDARLDLLKSYIGQTLLMLNISYVNYGAPRYTDDEVVAVKQKMLALLDIYYEDGDYGMYRENAAYAHFDLSRFAVARGDYATASAELKLAAEHAIKLDEEYDPETVHTSLLFRGKKYDGVIFNSTENHSLDMLHDMEKPAFDSIRGSAEFREIADELQKHARLRQ
ncbi:MAG: helix-turn-helix domain-containing protein [Oscillospiraceae bacterium]|jgi:transcriptional regulator with XRE-family HTH domain|nr:helix-turn-helix domain-containing protein [Oscillospiraceae bacterium]